MDPDWERDGEGGGTARLRASARAHPGARVGSEKCSARGSLTRSITLSTPLRSCRLLGADVELDAFRARSTSSGRHRFRFAARDRRRPAAKSFLAIQPRFATRSRCTYPARAIGHRIRRCRGAERSPARCGASPAFRPSARPARNLGHGDFGGMAARANSPLPPAICLNGPSTLPTAPARSFFSPVPWRRVNATLGVFHLRRFADVPERGQTRANDVTADAEQARCLELVPLAVVVR